MTYPNKKPATNIPIEISVTGTNKDGTRISIDGDDVKNTVRPKYADSTDKRGRAEFIVDVPRNVKSLKITVSHV